MAVGAALCASVSSPSAAQAGSPQPPPAHFQASTVLAHSQARYAALKSYTDTGSTMYVYQTPGAPGILETSRFRTAFAPPRRYLFDFTHESNGERIAVWANGAEFHSWWSATKTTTDYPQGQGASAFANASYPTQGVILQIAPLLFPSAGLQGSLSGLKDLKDAGIERISGHPCYRIEGRVELAYGTGAVSGAHPATLWIDVESLLVRKLYEDTSDDTGGGTTQTLTTTFEPRADPPLEPTTIDFRPPSS